MKSKITTAIFSFGVVPMLIVLKEQERQENYELCQLILRVIKELHPNDDTIPTTFTEDSLEWLQYTLNSIGLSGNTAINNVDSYVNKNYETLGLKRNLPYILVG